MKNSSNKATFIKPELDVKELTQALYEANLQLNSLNRQLKESEAHKSQLFANLNHDLRSPLSSLKAYVEYLQSFSSLQDLSTSEVEQILDFMNQRISHIEDLLSQILQYTVIESADQNEMDFQHIPAVSFIESFYYDCEVDPKYSNRHLTLELSDNINCYLMIDPKLMYRVFDNLFVNALKYSTDGCSIHLKAFEEEQQFHIIIKDNGIGIQKDELHKIFDRTFTSSIARTPDQKSYGLGLSIAKSIVLKHQGNIWCESEINVGSQFHITLPMIKE